MQKENLAIIAIISTIIISFVFAGILTQDTSVDDTNSAITPTAHMVYSFPSNTTNTNSLPSQSTTNASSNSSTPEKLVIADVQTNDESDILLFTVLNNGSSQTILSDISVEGHSVNIENMIALPPNAYTVISITLNEKLTFLRTYEIQLQTLEGDSAVFFKTCW